MAVYYVSKSGSDSSNGLGPDASHATNKPWLTIGKALGAVGISSGDTVYIGPGTYREVVTVAMVSATAETSVLGDPGNAQGFKDSSGALVTPALVVWTGYTTNDTTAPSSSATCALSTRDFLTFRYIVFVAGTANCMTASAICTNITLQYCTFKAISSSPMTITGSADTALNWTIDSCTFFSGISAVFIGLTLPTSGVADYDVNLQIKNCLFLGAGNFWIDGGTSGALANKPGGVDFFNCTGGGAGMLRTPANFSTSIPCTVYNCVAWGTGTALSANTLGQITEDYNRIFNTTPRANVNAGANSITSTTHAPLLEILDAVLAGAMLRPMFSPMAGSPLLGFGNQTGAPSVDILNRPRPAGGASTSNAIGAYERHDTAAKETTAPQASTTAIKITGPGDHDFVIPVDASSTSIYVYARYDTNHGTTNKPQAKLLGGGAVGVSDQTVTMTAAVDTWEQLSFSSITPTAKGYITLRLISRAAAGSGIAYFDTVSVI